MGRVLYGDEFLALCERVRREGRYLRRVDVKGAGYVVREEDILTTYTRKFEQEGTVLRSGTAEGRTEKTERCAPAVAQLWFDILKAS